MYAKIENGEVVGTGPPRTGRLDGEAVSNFHRLPDDVLQEEGWLPVVDEPPAHDPDLQTVEPVGWEVGEDAAERVYDVKWRPPSLSLDRDVIAADGADVATATYLVPDPDGRPSTVEFDVNGATEIVEFDEDGAARLEVAATAPGVIDVVVGDEHVVVTAEEA